MVSTGGRRGHVVTLLTLTSSYNVLRILAERVISTLTRSGTSLAAIVLMASQSRDMEKWSKGGCTLLRFSLRNAFFRARREREIERAKDRVVRETGGSVQT